ncbi:MAG: radical SAM protein [Candidatus Rokubacteria bacterium]|nr:radical SAM protein [Candidatus Rokubacteria bacterium]
MGARGAPRQPMTGTIHFYAPGLKRYRTAEYGGQDPDRFVSISVTGSECALACDHCNARVLKGMVPLKGVRLFDLCAEVRARGARGVLVSGGCDRRGRVPLLRHAADLRRARRELGLTIRVHPGLADEETAAALGEVDLDGAMLDVIGDEATIREVYHLDVRVEEYGRAMERLERYGVPLVPHIILGLHYGTFRGEWRALEMVGARHPKLLVLVVLMPLYGTAMARTAPPPVEQIGRFFEDARRALPGTPITLGCARPLGPVKREIDRLAVDAGLSGIAYPAEGIVAYARSRGLRPEFHDACCGVNSLGGEQP